MKSTIEVAELVKRFTGRGAARRSGERAAVDGVSFSVGTGETVGLVGESGAGKTTVARCVLGLEQPTTGSVRLFGQESGEFRSQDWRRIRRRLQAVFQDPKGAMNPRWTVESVIGEPLRRLDVGSNGATGDRVEECMRAVGLSPELRGRYRHQLSGGQQQRVSIARAISVHPDVIVLDEPVTALDASVKRDIVELLARLQSEDRLSYLLISHDLRIVRILCKRVVILFRGRVVEAGPTETVFTNAKHPYTRELLGAQLVLPGDEVGPRLGALHGHAEDYSSLTSAQDWGSLVKVVPEHYVAEQA